MRANNPSRTKFLGDGLSGSNLPPPPPPRSKATRAFTIVEVMMAAIVMVFAITSAITTLQRGFTSIDTARNLVIAGQIMQSEIEKIRVSPWSTTVTAEGTSVTGIVDYTNTSPTIAIDTAFTSNANIGTRFTLTRTMSDPKTDLRQITLTVSWRNYDGRQLSRTYTTYYARYGLYDFFAS